MNNKALELSAETTMTSLEIAELTGKRHDRVLRDIEAMLSKLEIGRSRFEDFYVSKQNKRLPMYTLGHQLTVVLVTGYSVKMNQAIIDRW